MDSSSYLKWYSRKNIFKNLDAPLQKDLNLSREPSYQWSVWKLSTKTQELNIFRYLLVNSADKRYDECF